VKSSAISLPSRPRGESRFLYRYDQVFYGSTARATLCMLRLAAPLPCIRPYGPKIPWAEALLAPFPGFQAAFRYIQHESKRCGQLARRFSIGGVLPIVINFVMI
jgi:hypothetical protein